MPICLGLAVRDLGVGLSSDGYGHLCLSVIYTFGYHSLMRIIVMKNPCVYICLAYNIFSICLENDS